MTPKELAINAALAVLVVYGWTLAVAFAFGFIGCAMTKIAVAVAEAKARRAAAAADERRALPSQLFERIAVVLRDGTVTYFTMPAGIDKVGANGVVFRRTDEAVPDDDGSRLAVVFRCESAGREDGGGS